MVDGWGMANGGGWAWLTCAGLGCSLWGKIRRSAAAGVRRYKLSDQTEAPSPKRTRSGSETDDAKLRAGSGEGDGEMTMNENDERCARCAADKSVAQAGSVRSRAAAAQRTSSPHPRAARTVACTEY